MPSHQSQNTSPPAAGWTRHWQRASGRRDVDNTQNSELVAPQNGFSLANPLVVCRWALRGFEEIAYYEGKGNFAIYDFEMAVYIPWNEPIGLVDWSPDRPDAGRTTQLTYTAAAMSASSLRPRQEGEAQQLSPDYDQGYALCRAFRPPANNWRTWLRSAPSKAGSTPVRQPVGGGEARSLGVFLTAHQP